MIVVGGVFSRLIPRRVWDSMGSLSSSVTLCCSPALETAPWWPLLNLPQFLNGNSSGPANSLTLLMNPRVRCVFMCVCFNLACNYFYIYYDIHMIIFYVKNDYIYMIALEGSNYVFALKNPQFRSQSSSLKFPAPLSTTNSWLWLHMTCKLCVYCMCVC